MSKKRAKNVLSNPGRALDLNVAKISKQPLSTLPQLITFKNTGKGLYFNKFVKMMLYKWNKKQKNFTFLHHLEKNELEQRLEKKLIDVNSFNNSINNIKQMIAYFKDKNDNSTKKYKISKHQLQY